MKLISKEDLADVQASLFRRSVEGLSWARMILLPVILVLLGLTLVGDRSQWRWGVLVAGAAVTVVGILCVAVGSDRLRWIFPRPIGFWGVQSLVAPGMAAMVLATGGFDSPLLPTIIVLSFLIGSLAPTRLLVAMTVIYAAMIAVMAVISRYGAVADLLPALFGGGPGVPRAPALLYAQTGTLIFTLVWGAFAANMVRRVFLHMVVEAIDSRDEALRSHGAHVRELTALSGELAHELKNPLANVKGLAVLVGRDVHGGKGAERLEVLQGEVSRMEEIIQGFLTFSRPLVPLNSEVVELKALCGMVLALHEGLAHGKGVRLELRAPTELSVSCDARKVKQVLINLIQNALDASPGGASVELVLLAGPDGAARLEVRDRGSGISPELREHLFEPGTSTKERGSGLGLALARGLARQHGGELSLEDRDGGGCIAALMLPYSAAAATWPRMSGGAA